MSRQTNMRASKNPDSLWQWFVPGPSLSSRADTARLSTVGWFWIIVAAAFLTRLIVLIQLASNHPAFDQPIVDSRWHYLWAKQIAGGDWIGHDVYFRAPLYPYFLALWMKVFGDGLWPIRLMQAFLGGITAGLTFLIGEKVSGRAVGLLAGAMAALYGTMIYYETELLVEVLAVPLGLWAVYLSLDEAGRPAPRPWRWLGIGAIVGLFAITRPNILLVVPAFWWWAWPTGVAGGTGSSWSRLKGPLALTLGVLLPVVPVTVRNYFAADDAVLISYQGGVNFWLGNNPSADGLTMQMPELVLDESIEWNEFVGTTDSLASALAGRELRKSEISSFWTNRTLNWITENPVSAITGWVRKTWYFLGGFEVSDQTDIYAFSKFSPVLNLLISHPFIYIPFGLMIPFALLGLVLTWRLSPQARPLVGFVILYALTVILFLATARHRLPVIPVLLVCAAVAILQFVYMLRQRRVASLMIPGAVAIALLILLNQPTVARMLDNPAFLHYQLALAHERSGDYESATIEYEKALEVEPNHLASRKNLAYSLMRMGAYDSAVAMSFSYLRHRRQDAEAYNNLGLAYLGQGDTTRAEGSFQVALTHNAKLPHPHFNLGQIAEGRKDVAAAVLNYRAAIEADSTFASAYSALALIYAANNNTREAEDLLKTGLRHVPDHAILQANLGSLYLRWQRTAEAIQPLERSVYWMPNVVGNRMNLAIAYIKMQRINAAQEQLRQIIRIDPANEAAQGLLSRIDSLGADFR